MRNSVIRFKCVTKVAVHAVSADTTSRDDEYTNDNLAQFDAKHHIATHALTRGICAIEWIELRACVINKRTNVMRNVRL